MSRRIIQMSRFWTRSILPHKTPSSIILATSRLRNPSQPLKQFHTYPQLWQAPQLPDPLNSSKITKQLAKEPQDPSNASKITKQLAQEPSNASKITKEPTPQGPSKLTKQQLLAQAPNPVSRMLVHIKWPLIRNNRPFSVDDFSAFVSWLVMGNVLWIVLGTTTFGLFIMYSVHTFDNIWNTLANNDERDESDNDDSSKKLNDTSILGYLTGSILTHGLGVRFEFTKGNVLPEWKDGMLRFSNFNIYSLDNTLPQTDDNPTSATSPLEFVAHVSAMNVSLSFNKWYEGNGLVDELELYGMNAKVYKDAGDTRGNINQIDHETASLDPKTTLNSMALSFSRYNDHHYQNDLNDHYSKELQSITQKPQPTFIDSNYELSRIKIHDTHLEIYDSKSTSSKPFNVTIFNCDLPKLRGAKLLIDFFNASNVTGLINDSMFTIHKRQNNTTAGNDNGRMVTFKLDGINLGTITQTNSSSKFNWIANGKAEIIADIRLPDLDKDGGNNSMPLSQEYAKASKVVSQLFNELASATNPTPSGPVGIKDENVRNDHDAPLFKSALAAIYHTFKKGDAISFNDAAAVAKNAMAAADSTSSEYVVVNVKVRFSNLKASIPKQLPMASSTLVPFLSLHDLRSLIAFVNNYDPDNNKSPIIVKTTVIEKLSEFDNLQDLSQTKIFDVIVSDIYEDLLRMVKWDEKRIIEQRSTQWSHSLASQLLLLGLGVLA